MCTNTNFKPYITTNIFYGVYKKKRVIAKMNILTLILLHLNLQTSFSPPPRAVLGGGDAGGRHPPWRQKSGQRPPWRGLKGTAGGRCQYPNLVPNVYFFVKISQKISPKKKKLPAAQFWRPFWKQ